MDTPYKKLTPGEAWVEAERRSLAIGIAGLVFVGALQAAGVIPTIYRGSLAPASGLVAAFLTAQTLFVAYYHSRWNVGALGAALTLILPYSVNLLWVRFTGRSLIYPVVALFLFGVVSLWAIHRRIPGPQWKDDPEDAVIQQMMEEFEFNTTWVDRVTWLCFAIAALLLLVILLR
jgi:hypothetical protein